MLRSRRKITPPTASFDAAADARPATHASQNVRERSTLGEAKVAVGVFEEHEYGPFWNSQHLGAETASPRTSFAHMLVLQQGLLQNLPSLQTSQISSLLPVV